MNLKKFILAVTCLPPYHGLIVLTTTLHWLQRYWGSFEVVNDHKTKGAIHAVIDVIYEFLCVTVNEDFLIDDINCQSVGGATKVVPCELGLVFYIIIIIGTIEGIIKYG